MKKRVEEITRVLDERYGTDRKIYLEHRTPWQLLFAVILSAQCTDARVNIVTKDLFVKYQTLEDFARADQKEMEQDIRSIGFYHNKAKNLIACAGRLIEDFGGEVPRELDDLLTLPGVGRKTANVIRGNVYDDPSIVVDTHVKRIARRLGLTEKTDPTDVEFDLMKVLPKDHWILFNLQGIAHGRAICKAQRPRCGECPLYDVCVSKGEF
ncbi:MAG: endonuclease III [Lachnospiraceae bacterium]|nr:endonuclease III [Lachnospiraceae bacterium]